MIRFLSASVTSSGQAGVIIVNWFMMMRVVSGSAMVSVVEQTPDPDPSPLNK